MNRHSSGEALDPIFWVCLGNKKISKTGFVFWDFTCVSVAGVGVGEQKNKEEKIKRCDCWWSKAQAPKAVGSS